MNSFKKLFLLAYSLVVFNIYKFKKFKFNFVYFFPIIILFIYKGWLAVFGIHYKKSIRKLMFTVYEKNNKWENK